MNDINEIQTDEGKLYLCVVLDLFSKLVIGWSMHHRQDRQIVIRAVERAVWQSQGECAVILHSDRGSPIPERRLPALPQTKYAAVLDECRGALR